MPHDRSMADLVVPGPAAAQLAYHLRMAAAFAAAGDVGECASEATLAWTILSMHGASALDATNGDLPGMPVAGASDAQWDLVRRRTHALALALQAHFVSEGQRSTAEVYESVAGAVDGAVAGLRGRR